MPEGAGGEVCQAIFGTCGIISIGCVTFPFGYRLRLQQGNRFFWDFDGLVGYENQCEGIYLPVQFNNISRQEYMPISSFGGFFKKRTGMIVYFLLKEHPSADLSLLLYLQTSWFKIIMLHKHNVFRA